MNARKIIPCGLVLAVALVSGCKKNSDSNAGHAAVQPESAAQNASTDQADPILTRQLQIFIRQKGRLPSDFEELVKVRLDGTAPAPPAGKKWVIDEKTTEVKAAAAE